MISMFLQITTEDNEIINLDYRSVKTIDIKRVDRQDLTAPSYGIISNGGSATIIDSNGNLIAKVIDKKIIAGTKLNLFIKNQKTSYVKSCGIFNITNINYDSDNKTLNFDFSDGLILWQEIVFPKKNIDSDPKQESVNMKYVYEYIVDKIKSLDTKKEFADLDDMTSSHLQNINVPCFYIDEKSVWNVFNSFAIASQTHIYLRDDGLISVKYNGGN